MSEKEFLRLALLSIASNSAFGNQRRNGYHSFFEWSKDIGEAAIALLHIAKLYKLIDMEDNKKPP